MFNVRIKKFLDAEQVQLFSHVMHSKGEVCRRQVDEETGEIISRKRLKKPEISGEWMDTPFTEYEDGIDYFYYMDAVLEEQKAKEASAYQSKCRTVSSIYDIARSNAWEWFFTFTFSPEKVNRYDYTECSKKFSVWLSNIRRVCPDMVYLAVPEQHKDGAFHFHGLFSNVDQLTFTYSGKLDKKGRCIYNIGNYRWGFTTATRVDDTCRAASYLCKYVTKDLCAVTSGKKRYWHSRNVKMPEVIEIYTEMEFMERIQVACSGIEDYHLKQIHTAYTDVLYIDIPIYTTNTIRFFKSEASDNKGEEAC